jgi:uncharacterized OB-fold protein
MTMTRPQGGGPADGAERKIPPKPLPLQENKALTDPFWQAAKRHELMIQRCTNCANWVHHPREQCPVCFSQKLEWAPVSGKGRVYAFTNVHQAQHPAFQEDTPYCFAIVQLDEGPRMVTNIVDIAPENVQCDMPVVATYDDVNDDWTLVKFKPA